MFRDACEALQGGLQLSEYEVLDKTYQSSVKTGLSMKLPTDLDGQTIDRSRTTYSVELKTKSLARGATRSTYFDHGKAVRE